MGSDEGFKAMFSLEKSGKVLRKKFTKSSSVLTFCGVKVGPSFALFLNTLAILVLLPAFCSDSDDLPLPR